MHAPNHYPVVVIGGGQAGLSASACLAAQGTPHLVLEQARVAESWRSQRWDSFCLVTPNWQCTLPGFAYDREYGGRDPDGFMVRDEIIAYIEAYRVHLAAPVVEGVAVTRLDRAAGRFRLTTSLGMLSADAVIVATGGYHRPRLPALAAALPDRVVQLHSATYRNPGQAPEGAILVVGTGQSGCQIAEDLHLAGRQVHLATGSAPRAPRFYRGRDVTAWLVGMGHYAVTVDTHPLGVAVRKKANHYLTGRGGGRDIDLRRFAAEGMVLHGRLTGIQDGFLQFGEDLAANLDGADAAAERIKGEIDKFIAAHGIDAPVEPPFQPCWQPGPPLRPLALDQVSTVVWGTGFALDYSWIALDAFQPDGYPIHRRGVSPIPGLGFLGLPWMHTWGSGRFSAVGEDAAHVVAAVAPAARRARA